MNESEQDDLQIAQLCRRMQLGEPVGALQPVKGGLLHRVWCLTTDRGRFAIKQLNPWIMQKPGARDNYTLSEQIAAVMAEHAVPAVVAIAHDGAVLQVREKFTLLVYPWIDGEVLPLARVAPERARSIGTLLGHMHTLKLRFSGLPVPEWEPIPEDDWDMLTYHAADLGVPWAGTVRAALPEIAAWSAWVQEADPQLRQTLVVSHRDVDQKNVLWRDATHPVLLDWEAAGLINPTLELLSAALAWSGQMQGAPDEASFHALLDGYFAAGGTLHAASSTALHGVMGTWLGWLLFNMRRSLGETTRNAEEQATGASEAFTTLTILRALALHGDTWAGWLTR